MDLRDMERVLELSITIGIFLPIISEVSPTGYIPHTRLISGRESSVHNKINIIQEGFWRRGGWYD